VPPFDAAAGLVRRLVSVAPGAQLIGAAGSGGEMWFVVAGGGHLDTGELRGAALDRDTGLWMPPGARYRTPVTRPLPSTSSSSAPSTISMPRSAIIEMT